MHPIFAKRKALPAICLSSNQALLTAIANDTDFSKIYSDQLEVLAKAPDMLLSISSSGMSANLVQAMRLARERSLMTISFSGKDGGRLNNLVDWNFIIPSFSIHRIQETQVLLLHVLWDLIHIQMGEDDIV
jgi:D-sedoheptulose 7-phosphate isomerase